MSAKRSTTTTASSAPGQVEPPADVPADEPAPTVEPRPCLKCGSPGYPYCKAHRASYQREYVAQREQMAGNRGFAMGVKTFREMMAAEFSRLGKVQFIGAEIAHAILNAPIPLWPVEPKPVEPVAPVVEPAPVVA